MDLYSVSFGGVQLNNSEFSKVMLHDFDQMPTITQNIAQVTSAHRSTITSKWYTGKTATIDLFARNCTAELQAKIARIRQVVQNRTGDLVLNRGVPKKESGAYVYDEWVEMTYEGATLSEAIFEIVGQTVVGTLTFALLNPIGLGETQSLFTGTATTNNTAIDLTTIDLQGTFNPQYPTITISVNNITRNAGQTLTITNQYNTLTYSGDLVAGDTLELNTYLATLTRNGNLVDYSGSIPTLPLVGQIFNIEDTYTSRNIGIVVTNRARYI